MDDKLQKQLIRQLKILNFWITSLGILILVSLAIIGFFLFQVITAIQNTTERLQSLQQETSERLDVQAQLCDSGLSGFLGDTCREEN